MDGATVRLTDLCELISEPVKPGERPDALYLGLEHLAPGRLVRIGCGQAEDMKSNTSAFQPGDVLYGKLRPYLDKAVLADETGVCTTELLVLRPKADVDPRFLAAIIHSPRLLEFAIAGTTGVQHPRTSWAHVREFEVPAFTFDEQQQIADLLWLVHQSISASETLVNEGQALKRAAMQTLFTRGLRGEEQKETEIGPVPESWTCRELGNSAEITYGAQAAVANATDPEIGTLILTNVNLDLEGHINLEKRRYYKVQEANRERLILSKGDVLFNWRSGSANHVGKTVLFDLDGEYTYSSFILRLRSHGLILNSYLFRWLTHLRESGFFTAQRNVSSINSVYNASLAATIPIWSPDSEQQSEIVATLDAIDRKIDLHRRKRVVLEEVFKALLHKLMTGEIRVGELDALAISSNPGCSTQPDLRVT